MILDQKDYILTKAKRYNIENFKLYATPIEQNLKLGPAQLACNEFEFGNLIGALLFVERDWI